MSRGNKTNSHAADESVARGNTGKDTEQDPQATQEANDQLLEAMAFYKLRNTVVNSVLIANPILKGIHDSTYASPIEQDLPPRVEARDEAAHQVAKATAARRRLLDELTRVESETVRATRRNRELAAEVLRLAAEADDGRRGALAEEPAAKDQIEKLEARLAASRQKWRVMKGTASGIVAGSGVDWANDDELRDVVLDPE